MHLPEPQDDSWTTFFVARVQAIFQADSTGPCRSNFNRLDGNLKDGHAVAAIVAVEKVKAAGLKLGMRASGAIDFVLRDLVGVGFLSRLEGSRERGQDRGAEAGCLEAPRAHRFCAQTQRSPGGRLGGDCD